MTFKITVHDGFFTGKDLSGTFEAKNEAAAIIEAKDFYAYALDTNMEDIQIVRVEEVRE